MKIDEETIVLDGVTYWRLWYRCPVCYHLRGYDLSHSFWVCKQCGGDVFIGDNAKLLCKDCGWSVHVSKTKFNCTNHCNCEDDTVETSDKGDLFDPSSIRPSILHRAGALWCVSLLSNMEN